MWIAVFVLALAARGAWGTWQLVRAENTAALEFPDEDQYWLMARSLANGDGLKDELGFRATRMPLYPALLAPFTQLANGVVVAKVLHWVVGAAVAALTALAAGTMLGPRAGWLAGLLVAVDPFLVFFSSLLLTETLFAGVLVALLWAAWPIMLPVGRHDAPAEAGRPGRATGTFYRRWIGVAVLAAIAVYVRESAFGLVLLLLLLMLLSRRFDGRSVVAALITGGAVLMSLLPWAARNRAVTGDWCWLTHRGGISLYDGVRPGATGSSDLGGIKQMPAVRGLAEAEWNRYFLDRSFEAIRDEPGRILRLAGVKLSRMWNPFPNVETYQSSLARVVSAAWTLPTFALALAGAILLPMSDRYVGWRMAFLLLLPALYLSALHSVFVGSVRYRLGAVPMLEILAAVALVALIRRLTRSKDASEPT
jgi:hypothetical protein